MPLIRPEIQQVLRDAGLMEEKKNSSTSAGSVSEKLDAAGLSMEETIEYYSDIVRNSSNESLRKSALDTVLKMHGALKESTPPPPSFTIVIQESSGLARPTQENKFNLPAGVNPILLPRQLLKEYAAAPVATDSKDTVS